MKFLTDGCEDSHIKIPKDTPEYVEKERMFLGRPEGERVFSEEDPKEPPRLPGGKRRYFLKGNLRETP